MNTPLTDEQTELFHAITSGEYRNFGLVSTTFAGVDCAVIAAFEIFVDADAALMTPVAILIDSSNEDYFMERMDVPHGATIARAPDSTEGITS